MTAQKNHLHERLRALALNLWWTWHPEVISLVRDLNPHLWREVDHNPIAFLNRITPEEIEERASELVSTMPSGACMSMSMRNRRGEPYIAPI